MGHIYQQRYCICVFRIKWVDSRPRGGFACVDQSQSIISEMVVCFPLLPPTSLHESFAMSITFS